MRYYKLFQAWQNQNKDFTDYISNILKKVAAVEKKKGINIEIIRYPAQNEAGSPDVVDMVWEQISLCDLFVGDLTAIAEKEDHLISNPNVMYEVGIADALLGEKRVILLCFKDTDISKLAFDVNHKRISPIGYNSNTEKNLLNWVESAIQECDIQQIQRDFIFKDLYDDLYIIYNNFMRLVYHNDFEYSEGVDLPKKATVKNKLKTGIFNELMISINYDEIINRLRMEIRRLYETGNKRYLIEIIRIYKAVDKYNWFMHSVDKASIFVEASSKYDAILLNADTLYVKKIRGIDKLYESVLFNNKFVYLSGSNGFQHVYMKEMITDEIKETCHYQKTEIKNGTIKTMKMCNYSMVDGVEGRYSGYVYEVLASVYDFMEKMNYVPTNNNTDICCNTIIMWEKS